MDKYVKKMQLKMLGTKIPMRETSNFYEKNLRG